MGSFLLVSTMKLTLTAVDDAIGSKILYLQAFGRPMVIINDVKIAQDLLEKRSALYSSR